MKKLLLTLTLLLTLGFAASAADYSDELTSANFTGMTYTTSKTYTATNGSGAAYLAQASSNSGFQMRTSKAGTGVKNTSAPEGYIIESIEITFNRTGGGVNVYAADSEINLKGLPSTVTEATTTNAVINVNAPYFAITPTNDTYCVVSKVVVNWVSTTSVRACATPVFSVEDGAELFAGQTITVNKGNADACELLANGEPVNGLEYTIPTTAEVGSTITLTANSTLEGGDPAEATASINVFVVAKPVYSMFDFENEATTTYSSWPNGAVTGTQQNLSHTIDGVLLNATGRLTLYNGTASSEIGKGWGLRLYTKGGNAEAGKVTITAPEGYYITSIEFNSDKFSDYTNADNDKSVVSKDFTATATTIVKSIKVYIATLDEPETELVAFTHEESFGKTEVRMNYMLHLNNHKPTNVYTVVLTVNGVDFPCTDHTDTSIVEETANAPMRVLNPDDVASETTLKGTILATGLEGESEYPASVSVKLGDKELHNATIENFKTGTTGIEDVTVENEAAEYFNLQGVRVAEPRAGQIYIVRRGAKATKELVK